MGVLGLVSAKIGCRHASDVIAEAPADGMQERTACGRTNPQVLEASRNVVWKTCIRSTAKRCGGELHVDVSHVHSDVFSYCVSSGCCIGLVRALKQSRKISLSPMSKFVYNNHQ